MYKSNIISRRKYILLAMLVFSLPSHCIYLSVLACMQQPDASGQLYLIKPLPKWAEPAKKHLRRCTGEAGARVIRFLQVSN